MAAGPTIKANVYISDAEGKHFWAKRADAEVRVARTGENEIWIGVATRGDIDDCSIYLTDQEAARLAEAVASPPGFHG